MGANCLKMPKKLTTEEFIIRAKIKHNNKYGYSLVTYNNSKEKIKIKCEEHGIFEQIPNSHLNGKGCSKCSGLYQPTTEEFIKSAKLIHGDKYDYSLLVYKGNKIKSKIICKEHGIFEQTPNNHLKGQNCYYCIKIYNNEIKLKMNLKISKFLDKGIQNG